MYRIIILSAIILVIAAQYVMAGEIFIEKDMNKFFKPASPGSANATCFIYPNNQYKCACRFSDNSKLWASKEVSRINGMTQEVRHGNIKECER